MAFDFNYIIVGTGFGATVAATKLALENGKTKILMLERGVWWFTPERPVPPYFYNRPQNEPIQYWPRPDHARGVFDLMRVVKTNNEFVEGLRNLADRPDPLYRFNSYDEVDILTASGVGGGSLIYSNVSLAPYFDGQKYPVMDGWAMPLAQADYDAALQWMAENRGRPANVVTRFPMPINTYPNLAQMLRINPSLYLGRSRWLKDASEQLGPNVGTMQRLHSWAPLDLQVLEYGSNTSDDPDKFTYCERQGRCFLGCLPGARHTLNKTLLDAKRNLVNGPNAPVELRSMAEVHHIEPLAGGGYAVFYKNVRPDSPNPDQLLRVTAPVVILAAGTLGSTELLLRSQGHFKFSGNLGRKFSTNGDSGGFVHYKDGFHYGIYTTRGPINTSHVMYSDGRLFLNVEDAGVPAMLAGYVKKAIEVFANGVNRDPFFQGLELLWKMSTPPGGAFPDPTDPKSFETEAEMLQHTFFFNVMGRDEARGKFSLNALNKLTLAFENGPLSNDTVFKKIDEVMAAMAQAMQGQYVRFPFWKRGGGFVDNNFTPERKMVTTHPLGGLPMGNSAAEGVVDKKGRVFNATPGSPQPVYDGLYVMDGSIIPGALAVNPTLTIVAYALKIAAGIP